MKSNTDIALSTYSRILPLWLAQGFDSITAAFVQNDTTQRSGCARGGRPSAAGTALPEQHHGAGDIDRGISARDETDQQRERRRAKDRPAEGEQRDQHGDCGARSQDGGRESLVGR